MAAIATAAVAAADNSVEFKMAKPGTSRDAQRRVCKLGDVGHRLTMLTPLGAARWVNYASVGSKESGSWWNSQLASMIPPRLIRDLTGWEAKYPILASPGEWRSWVKMPTSQLLFERLPREQAWSSLSLSPERNNHTQGTLCIKQSRGLRAAPSVMRLRECVQEDWWTWPGQEDQWAE